MKKFLIFVLAAAMALSCFALGAFAEEPLPEGLPAGTEAYPFGEGTNIGLWLASVAQDGEGGWIAVSEESYVSATFKATKAFSAFLIPFWAGNPDNFVGITPVDVEFAIFKAVDGNYGSDYNSDDAIVKEVFTFNHDQPEGFLWQFNQIPKGKYCIRITQLTEEGGYFVVAQGDYTDDYIEFDYDNAMTNSAPGLEAISLTLYYDPDELQPTEDPNATEEPTPTPTAEPTATPEVTEAPAETEAPEEPTQEPASEPTDAPQTTPEPAKKKGCGNMISGGMAVLLLAGTALFIGSKKRH
ncbi:MAG: hypothetical protein IKY07_03555 [Clostridia bacterium]|nr:hypothetical protein [Clostridia bacterium]